MSKGISKFQLALAIAKGKRVELQFVLDNASGGGSWRRVIITRIDELTKEIDAIQGRTIEIRQREDRGLINEA